MFSGGYLGYMIIAGLMSLVGMWVSGRLKRKFDYYSRIRTSSGMSGKEVAEEMLHNFGIYDVKVIEGQGFLTDHYNPLNKTVSLSSGVFNGKSVASAAIAAHECGHAVQHANAYPFLRVRSGIVPVVKFASVAQQWLLIFALGGLGIGMSGSTTLLFWTIVAYSITTLFALVTLPVEFDASRRALVWLDQSGVARDQEYAGARDALQWAAMTYVASALASLVVLLYLIARYAALRD
jgi:Zn-dependent membrane protease YugP